MGSDMASATAKTLCKALPDPLNSVQNAAFVSECSHHGSVADAGRSCRARLTRHAVFISRSKLTDLTTYDGPQSPEPVL